MENLEEKHEKDLTQKLDESLKKVRQDEIEIDSVLDKTHNDIREVEEIVEEIKDFEEHHHEKHEPEHSRVIKLIFIVNGTAKELECRLGETLKTAVEKALKATGNEGRPLQDWAVKWNEKELDIEKKIEDFHFQECSELFVSLKAGKGGAIGSYASY